MVSGPSHACDPSLCSTRRDWLGIELAVRGHMQTATATDTVTKSETKPKRRYGFMFAFIAFMALYVVALVQILGQYGGARGAPAGAIVAAICGIALIREGRVLSGAPRVIATAVGALFILFVFSGPVTAIVSQYRGHEAARDAVERLHPGAGPLVTDDDREVYEFEIRNGDRTCTGRALVNSSVSETPDVIVLPCEP
jgi:hypothetical protein